MNNEQLIEVSRKFGSDKRYVIAGGGNTSYKDDAHIWVKASGYALATITENGFAMLDRKKLNVISEKIYPIDSDKREEEVKNDLYDACITKDRRPSVETSLHNSIDYGFVVHLHPAVVNGLMCSRNAKAVSKELFGADTVFIDYVDPGYTLFKKVEETLSQYKRNNGKHPHIVWLQNHGIFVGADSIEEIESLYNHVICTIEKQITVKPYEQDISISRCEDLDCFVPRNDGFVPQETIPPIRMMLSKQGRLKTLKIRTNSRTLHFASSKTAFDKVAVPFTPDEIVYCKSTYIYLSSQRKDELLKEAQNAIDTYIHTYRHTPKVLVIKGIGIVAVGDNAAECDTILDMYEDMMTIAEMAPSFGGIHAMTQEQINFIDHWEVENYRRKVNAKTMSGRVQNKIIIVTGAAQGFGEGIAECLLKEGANLVIADLNEYIGKATVKRLEGLCKANRVLFVKTDVTAPGNLQSLVRETVCNFGGLDVFISNAGVLHAGGLDTLSMDEFELVTRVNYNAYFYCVKAASHIMKLQNEYAPANFGDIIQINSKSGLRGSKANFAYAGSKFGGIGLTQSFALELAPYRIKVNAICPGNYYEGPLWSNPENGLFKQYLQTGKVPGATTIDDVRKFYMDQVPMRKGTNPVDVTKAILYLIEQTCETGQALPVTGGQVMIN